MSGRITLSRLDDSPLWAFTASYFSRALIDHSKAVPGMHFERSLGPHRNAWVGRVDAVAAVRARLSAQGIRIFGDDIPTPDSWRTARTPYLFSTERLREYQVEGVQSPNSKFPLSAHRTTRQRGQLVQPPHSPLPP